MAIGPLAIDMYLPALPTLATEFSVDAARVQHTLSAYLLGLAVGQLAFGPIADRYGRKPPLVGGLVVFTLASVGCLLAGTIGHFVVLRFAQALGGASGMVVIRAVIRDKFDEIQSARVLSLMMLVMGAAPILAPLGGGAASFITVSQVNRRMVARHGVRRVLGWGVYGLAGGATALLAFAASGLFGFAGVFIPIFVIVGSIGFIASNATSVAMAPFGERAGAASSLLGATQSAFGVAASAAVGWIGNRGPVPMATVMFACAATAFLAYALLVRKPRSSP